MLQRPPSAQKAPLHERIPNLVTFVKASTRTREYVKDEHWLELPHILILTLTYLVVVIEVTFFGWSLESPIMIVSLMHQFPQVPQLYSPVNSTCKASDSAYKSGVDIVQKQNVKIMMPTS